MTKKIQYKTTSGLIKEIYADLDFPITVEVPNDDVAHVSVFKSPGYTTTLDHNGGRPPSKRD